MLDLGTKMGRKPLPPKAPYIPKGWMQNFLELIKRVRLQTIDRGVVKQYSLTAEGNESKLIGALRFLGLVDEEGKIDQAKLTPLKMEGESFQKAFDQILHASYADVFRTLDVEKANATDLKNFFTGHYHYSQVQSAGAAVLFSFLCELAGIKVSPDIAEINKQSARYGSEDKGKKRIKKESKKQVALESSVQELPSEPVDGGEYVIILRGKDFSLNRNIRNEEDLDLIIQTLKLNCRFKKNN